MRARPQVGGRRSLEELPSVVRRRFTGSRVSLLFVLFLLVPMSVTAGPTISVETLVPYADSSEVRDSIREECGLGTRLTRRIVDKGQNLGITVVRISNLDTAAQGPTLAIRITDAIAIDGGLFPSKSISIDGVLKAKNKVVGTFVATRFARAGLLPSERDDCVIYSHAIDRLAKDVAKWLGNPGMDSHLGDAR